jgi:hypothetical protein
VCALNRVDPNPPLVDLDQLRPLVSLDQLPGKAVLVGGATSRGGKAAGTGAGRFVVGLGDPNRNNVVGNVGDIYQRVDTTPGPRLFVVAARPCTRSHRAADGQHPPRTVGGCAPSAGVRLTSR